MISRTVGGVVFDEIRRVFKQHFDLVFHVVFELLVDFRLIIHVFFKRILSQLTHLRVNWQTVELQIVYYKEHDHKQRSSIIGWITESPVESISLPAHHLLLHLRLPVRTQSMALAFFTLLPLITRLIGIIMAVLRD